MSPIWMCRKETVKVDANTTRTVERTFGRDSDGRKTLVQVTEEEKRTLPGGEVKVVRTTSDPDANGALQTVQRETSRYSAAQFQRAGNQEHDSYSLAERRFNSVSADHGPRNQDWRSQRSRFTSPLRCLTPTATGSSAKFREGTVKGDGKDSAPKPRKRVLRPGTDGNLSVVERTVSKQSENTAGEKRETVETYSTNLPGTPIDGSLHLNQQVTTVYRKGQDGTQSTATQVEQRNACRTPATVFGSRRRLSTSFDPGTAGTTRETQTLRSLDSNGELGVVSVDTRKQDNSPAVQVNIAPAKTPQPAPAH